MRHGGSLWFYFVITSTAQELTGRSIYNIYLKVATLYGISQGNLRASVEASTR